MFEKWFAGSTGDPPVPSGDAPDGTGATVRANGHGLFATLLAAVPVGGSPIGTGGSPAPPIFKTGSCAIGLHRVVCCSCDDTGRTVVCPDDEHGGGGSCYSHY